jgi:hypothetical protein
MPDKQLKIPPQYVPNSAGNLLNSAVTTLGSGVGYTPTQPYLVLSHIRLTNKSASAVTVTLYIGLTGGSSGGTEFAFNNVAVPAESSLDWYGNQRLDSTDFLTGVASAASEVTIEIDAKAALS